MNGRAAGYLLSIVTAALILSALSLPFLMIGKLGIVTRFGVLGTFLTVLGFVHYYLTQFNFDTVPLTVSPCSSPLRYSLPWVS